MSAILGAPELNWNIDDVNGGGTITLHEYADGKNGALVATMAGTDEKAVALAVLFTHAPELVAALEAGERIQRELYGDAMRLHLAMIDWAEAARAALAKAKGGA